MKTAIEPISINIKEASKATGIPPRTLQDMAKRGQAPARRIRNRYIFPVVELKTWIENMNKAGSN